MGFGSDKKLSELEVVRISEVAMLEEKMTVAFALFWNVDYTTTTAIALFA